MRVITSLRQISASDLRIAGRYRGLAFRLKQWRRPHADWDHDHCFFCKVCICDSGEPGHLSEAFVIRYRQDSPFWVCRRCFEIVSPALDWRIDTPPDFVTE